MPMKLPTSAQGADEHHDQQLQSGRRPAAPKQAAHRGPLRQARGHLPRLRKARNHHALAQVGFVTTA